VDIVIVTNALTSAGRGAVIGVAATAGTDISGATVMGGTWIPTTCVPAGYWRKVICG